MATKRDMTGEEMFNFLTQKKSWVDFFTKTPCVKSSYLWGIGCGALMTAHKARIYPGKVGKAFSAGILTFLCVSTFSFINCADEVNKKHEAIRFALQNQQFMKDMEEEENKRRN